MALDLEALLKPISDDAPCGPNLEYEGIDELDRMAAGVPEKQVGDSIIPAEEPDWREVRDGAMGLLEKTHDLRVVVQLTKALLKIEGLCGLRDGLALLHGMLTQHWGCVYPQLDPDDNNDPTERINALRIFSSKEAKGDESPMIRMVREARLCYSARMREGYSLRDILVARGEMKSASGTTIEMPRIDAAFADTEPEALATSAAAAAACVELVGQLDTYLDEQVGAGQAIHFGDLRTLLTDISTRLNGFLENRGLGGATEAAAGDGAADGAPAAAAGSAGGKAISGDVQSAGDVTRMIDKICQFYARTEPSSPVPLILQRARRLVGKNFWELIQDLSPGSVEGIRTITGGEPPAAAEATE